MWRAVSYYEGRIVVFAQVGSLSCQAVFYLFRVCWLRSQGRAVWSACFLKAHLCFTSWLVVWLHLDYVRGYIV